MDDKVKTNPEPRTKLRGRVRPRAEERAEAWKLATLNVCKRKRSGTFTGDVVHTMMKHNVDVLAITEVNANSPPSRTVMTGPGGARFLFVLDGAYVEQNQHSCDMSKRSKRTSRRPPKPQLEHGRVGFVVREDPDRGILHEDVAVRWHENGLVASLCMKMHGRPFDVIGVYHTSGNSTIPTQKSFTQSVLQELEAAIFRARGNYVILGDFNVTLGGAWAEKHGHLGQCMQDWMDASGLECLQQTRCKPRQKLWTRAPHSGTNKRFGRSMPDLILAPSTSSANIMNFQSVNTGFGSDHLMLKCKYLTRDRRRTHTEQYQHKKTSKRRELVQQPTPEEISTMRGAERRVEEAQRQTLERYDESHDHVRRVPQFPVDISSVLDKEYWAAVRRKHDLQASRRMQWGSTVTKAEVKRQNKEVWRLQKKAWEQYWEQWADAVELAAAEGRTAAMYAMIRRKYHPRVRQAPEPPERQDDCVDYIEGLLTHPTIPLPPQQMHVAPTHPLPPVRTHTPMMTSTNETLEKHVLMETGTRKRGTQINFGYGVAGSATIEMSGRCWGKPQCAERALLSGMIELLERVKKKQLPERVVV